MVFIYRFGIPGKTTEISTCLVFEKGGGALLDTSHEINYLQYFFGKVQKVNGQVDIISNLDITSDDLTTGNIYFKMVLKPKCI